VAGAQWRCSPQPAGAVGAHLRAFDHTTGVHGEARLHAAPTGAEIELTVAGLSAGERCVMVAVSVRGVRHRGHLERHL
jgi:hypothetical protein